MKKSVFTILLIVMLVACVFSFTACKRYKVNLFGWQFYIGGDGESSSVVYDENGNPVDPNAPTSEQGTPGENSQAGQKPPTSQTQKPPTSQGGQKPPTSQTQKPTESSSQGDTSTGGGNAGSDIPHPVDDSYFVEGKGLSETAYVVWKETKVASAEAYYKKSGASNYTKVHKELIRDIGGGKARVDILGLAAGTYDIKIVVGSANKEFVCEKVSVNSYDRSGYAHFGYTKGVGAYNDDGTLKSGVKVVYITEATKNSAGGGVASALKSSNVCVRIIGRVTTDTKTKASSWEGKYTKINGLKEKANSGDGSVWGLCEVEGKSNITLEGVGADAELYQWGVSFKRCNSLEVRNLTFTDYPEDACELNGGSDAEMTKYGNYWVHNNVFNQGKRLFDDSDDQDKKEGDGAIDVKFCHNVTYSYNKVVNCHKTGLVGGGDSNQQKNITYHHNYFTKCQSRMPLGRQANMHYYNNYFESITSVTMEARKNAYIFSEANYFYKSKNPCRIKDGGAIKSFNDKFDGCSGDNKAVKVTDRTKTVSNNCSFGKTFDTDSKNFYYDSSKKVSKVRYLSSAEQAKTDCKELAGPCKANK